MQKKIKQFQGNIPEQATFVARFGEEGRWLLFFRNQQTGYANFKMVYDGRCPDKANFWLGYNITTKKFSAHNDSFLLHETLPSLYEEVVAWLAQAVKEEEKLWVRAAVLAVQAKH